MSRMNLFFAVVLSVLAAGAAQAADKPVALIVDVVGETVPPLSPYSEVMQGQDVKLSAGAQVKFSHYDTCKDVEVVGGEIQFDDFEYRVKDGKATETGEGCPQVISAETKVASAAIAGGVVFRGAPTSAGNMGKMDTTLILVGNKSHDAARVQIEQAGATVLDWAPDGTTRAHKLPAGIVKSDVPASLQVLGKDGGTLLQQDYVPGSSLSLIRVN